MNDARLRLKTDKEKLPFPFPGQVSYQDFTDQHFQTCDSRVFIRPVLLLQSLIPAHTDRICLPHMEDCCFLLYIKDGQGQLVINGKDFNLSSGSGFLTAADHALYLNPTGGPLSCLLFLLTGDLLWALYKAQKEQVVFFTRYQFPDFEQRLGSLLGEYLLAESPLLFDFSRHMDHLLSRIVHLSIRAAYDKDKEKKQSLMRAMTYMKEHCCEQIQVGEIAAAFGYSGSHFSRIFQAEFHQSPKRYLRELRVAHAEKLLMTSDLSIEAIGQECGFNTTTHFIQTFRDMHVMTPLQYRKEFKP